ncbi:MAG: hypothetical protein B6I25_02710 [Planctomycetales bacterium 4572_13]|nr:MAG: hypothetical protein B6I25_02710 [Planctomycetales bacterium 4572_13]
MKKILFVAVMSLALLVSAAHAGLAPSILPTDQDTHYYGSHDRSFDLGSGDTLDIHLEFAVYAGTQAQTMQEWTGHTGGAEFVYAYQVFSESSSISEAESLNGTPSGGIGPASSDFNTSVTKAIWQFDEGTLVQGTQSWFLFLYSDYDWIKGDIEVQPLADDDIPIPGVPEPTTLALLACGTLLSLKRRKKQGA